MEEYYWFSGMDSGQLSSPPWGNYCSDIKTLIIGDSVTAISALAFGNCTGITSIYVGKSVTHIGKSAFGGCNSLTSITVNADNPAYSSQDGVLFNKNRTLLIQYPNRKTGAYIIPASVTTIGMEAFYLCEGLTSVEIPEGVTIIEDMAFHSVTTITSITIPNSVTTIGSAAFALCSGLKSLTIGNSVKYISEFAFSSADLISIISNAVIPPELFEDIFDPFDGVNRSIPVYVPEGSVQAYQMADGWKKFSNIMSKRQ
jgi:hypothetical protein